MGRLFLVELDLVPRRGTQHLRCRRCYPVQIRNIDINYVALKANRVYDSVVNAGLYYTYTYDLDHQSVLAGNYCPVHFYTEVANVVFGEPMVQRFYGKIRGTMADMFCIKCNMHLGWKFIESCRQKYKYLEGVYAFDRRSLHLWSDEVRDRGNYIGRERVCN